ncbi:MAG: DUF2452 domain-containing protein [Chitinophagaceae bacterium]
MVQAYNFLAAWQLFPEKCIYESGMAPKSGNYKIDSVYNGHALSISINWVSLDNEAFYTQYTVTPDGERHDFENKELADELQCSIINASNITTVFFKDQQQVLRVVKEIMPNGYLRLSQDGVSKEGKAFKNVELYHKQLNVLPYASSVGSVVIRPTKEGVIKHKALSAMEEQTEMQLDQIRAQIELLARQATEIRKRKELSLMVYEARLSFKPQIGQTYHLYEKGDGSHTLSLVAPEEWGGSGPFKLFVASVRLLADHTWKEIDRSKKKQPFEDIEFE